MAHALLCCGTSLPPTTKRDGANHWLRSDARKAFLVAYEDFVRDVILPRVDAATPGHAPCGRLVYQTEPTIRVSLPGQARPPGGKARSSSEHFHQNGELSVWVPLTSSMDSGAMNSQRELQAVAAVDGDCCKRGEGNGGGSCDCEGEKEADAPQLLPFNLSAGEIAMFWGHRLKYGFVGRNETGHSVVGIDFHVVPWPLYKESRQDGKRSSHSLRLGSYYSVMDARGAEPIS